MRMILSLVLLLNSCFGWRQETLFQDKGQEGLHSSMGPLDAEFDELVMKTMEHFHLPGLSISVIEGNSTFAKGYGMAEYPNKKATPETLYYTGSTTKSFTAASILILIEDSVDSAEPLKLTMPISSVIREDFVLQDEYATRHVTLEDALSHRTGMPRHDLSYGGHNFTVRDMVRHLRYLPLSAEIRTEWQYCNMMYVTVSYVIETITKIWLGEFLHTRIWKPLSMQSTFFSLQDAQKSEATGGATLSRGYYWNNQTKEFIPQAFLDAPENSGAGSVISNVLDYAKYLRAMVDMDTRILTKDSYHTLRQGKFLEPSTSSPFTLSGIYGLGWEIAIYRNAEVFSHGGSVTGFGALMAYIPSKNWGVAIMSNTDVWSNRAEQVLWFALMDRLFETPKEDRYDWIAKFDRDSRAAEELRSNTTKRLYPDAPSGKDRLAPTLPLTSYAGTYSHPGYQNMTLTLAEACRLHVSSSTKCLHADNFERTWKHSLNFEHVTGDYFIALVDAPKDSPSALFEGEAFRSQFRIGPDGIPCELGIAYEPKMGNDMIWFKRTV